MCSYLSYNQFNISKSESININENRLQLLSINFSSHYFHFTTPFTTPFSFKMTIFDAPRKKSEPIMILYNKALRVLTAQKETASKQAKRLYGTLLSHLLINISHILPRQQIQQESATTTTPITLPIVTNRPLNQNSNH